MINYGINWDHVLNEINNICEDTKDLIELSSGVDDKQVYNHPGSDLIIGCKVAIKLFENGTLNPLDFATDDITKAIDKSNGNKYYARYHISKLPDRELIQLYYKTGNYNEIKSTYYITSDVLDDTIKDVLAERYVENFSM